MSTLVAQTISNGTVSTSTANVINGAKAWVNFNGVPTVSIRGSYNVSSVTRSTTGTYTINFTNAFADANYAWAFGGWNNGTGNGGWIAAGTGSGSYPTGVSTTSLGIVCYSSGGTLLDETAVCVSVFR